MMHGLKHALMLNHLPLTNLKGTFSDINIHNVTIRSNCLLVGCCRCIHRC